MNFGEKIKTELLGKSYKAEHCKLALLAGILRGSGVIVDNEGEIGLQFVLTSDEMATLLGDLLRTLFNYEIRELEVDRDRLNNRDKITVNIMGDIALEILKTLDVLVENGEELTVNLRFFGSLTQKECCLSAFISGLFLVSGSCTIPDDNKSTTGYHLELAFSRSSTAGDTAGVLLSKGIDAKIMRRRKKYSIYIKSEEGISDFLAFIKAYSSAVIINDVMVNRNMKNQLNRQNNCDIANVGKQVNASIKHKMAIDLIEKTVGLNSLTTELYQVAIARRDNPDDTLFELSKRLNITKSCLNHRLRKIVAIANQL